MIAFTRYDLGDLSLEETFTSYPLPLRTLQMLDSILSAKETPPPKRLTGKSQGGTDTVCRRSCN